MKKTLLFDGTGILFRSYYAIPNLRNSRNEPTGGILGFFNILFKELLKHKPTHFAVCFDRAEPTFRKIEYTEYKAQRTKAPDELFIQLNIVKELLKMGLNLTEEPGYEADDLIACLNAQKEAQDKVLIYSSDQDLLQLVDSNSSVIKPGTRKLGDTIFTPEKVIEKYELTPKQIIDFKAICGDPSDNLKGINGIGKKTAVKLIKEYKNLENIYQNLDKLTPKMKEKFEKDKEIAFLCKKMATLVEKVENCPSIELLDPFQIKYEDLKDAFIKLECNTLVAKLKLLEQIWPNKSSQVSLFT